MKGIISPRLQQWCARTAQYIIIACSCTVVVRRPRSRAYDGLTPWPPSLSTTHCDITVSVSQSTPPPAPLLLLISHRTANFGFTDGRRRGRLQFTDLTHDIQTHSAVLSLLFVWPRSGRFPGTSGIVVLLEEIRQREQKCEVLLERPKSKFSDTLNIAFGENWKNCKIA